MREAPNSVRGSNSLATRKGRPRTPRARLIKRRLPQRASPPSPPRSRRPASSILRKTIISNIWPRIRPAIAALAAPECRARSAPASAPDLLRLSPFLTGRGRNSRYARISGEGTNRALVIVRICRSSPSPHPLPAKLRGEGEERREIEVRAFSSRADDPRNNDLLTIIGARLSCLAITGGQGACCARG